jgi:hypothetical protein
MSRISELNRVEGIIGKNMNVESFLLKIYLILEV